MKIYKQIENQMYEAHDYPLFQKLWCSSPYSAQLSEILDGVLQIPLRLRLIAKLQATLEDFDEDL